MLGSDVIVGADGLYGIVRKHLLAENEQGDLKDEPTGFSVYSATLPKSTVTQDPELATLYDDTKVSTPNQTVRQLAESVSLAQKHLVTLLMGHERSAQTLIVVCG